MKKLFSLFVPLLALFLTLAPQTAKADYVDDNLIKPLTIEFYSAGTQANNSSGQFKIFYQGTYNTSSKSVTKATVPNLQYRVSTNGGAWGAWTSVLTNGSTTSIAAYGSGPTAPSLGGGTSPYKSWKVQLRGVNLSGFNRSSSDYFSICLVSQSSTRDFTVSGNIMSLIVGYDSDNETAAQAALASADEIPNDYCFYRLFHYINNNSISPGNIDASNLIFPATKLKNSCYQDLFYDAKNEASTQSYGLKAGPTFLATDFVDKTNTKVSSSFAGLCKGCKKLTSIHVNFQHCYEAGEDNLTNWLKTGATSPYPTLYAPEAFRTCEVNNSGLSNAVWNNWTKTEWSKAFVSHTITFKDSQGKIVETKEVTEGSIPTYTGTTNLNISGKVLKWYPALVAVTKDAEYQAYYVDEADYFTVTNTHASQSLTVQLKRGSSPPTNVTLNYRIVDAGGNAGAWQTLTTVNTTTNYTLGSIPAGSRMQFYGNNTAGFGQSTSNFWKFYFGTTGSAVLSGELMSIFSGTETSIDLTMTLPNHAFYGLFYDNSAKNPRIISVGNLKLSATNLGQNCYQNMFNSCANMVDAPATLPATTLTASCYQNMFSGCISLVTAPILPATTMASSCYASMFSGCSALTAAPQLNATTLTEGCYQNMFQNCTSLTDVQETLPGTNLPQNCYAYMFSGCSALTTAPEIMASANTIPGMGACDNMFASCTSLTKAPSQLLPETVNSNLAYGHMFFNCPLLTEGPDIHATTISNGGTKLQYMFSTASNLRKIRVYFPAWGSMTFCSYWTNSVAATGDFYCPPALARRYNNNEQTPSYIPTGWTVYSYNVTFVPVECTWEDATNANKQFTWKTDTSDVNSFLKAEAGAKFYTNEACTVDAEITVSEIQALLSTQQESSAETTKYIYARKVSSYALSWNANGGVLSGDYTATGSVNAGATITAPTATRTGYTFTGWAPYFTGTMPSTNVTYIAQWTKATTLDLYDNENADYYNAIKTLGNTSLSEIERTYSTVIYHRSTAYTSDNGNARWYTLCLPFNADQSQLAAAGMLTNAKIYEYRYAKGSADENDHVTFHFRAATSIIAGQGYLVKATGNMGPDFEFTGVTLDTDKDTESDVNALKTNSANAYKESGDIAIVGVLRNDTLHAVGKQVMGLANNKIWYPHSSGNPMPAYRAYFYNPKASASSVMPRVRIVVEGEGTTELEVVDGELYDAGGDVRAPSGAARKYIRNGVLIIERNGERYNAQGARM